MKNKKKPFRFATKVLGQNFLVDSSVVQEILQIADVTKEDTVIEIGPGRGAMTFQLAREAKRLIAIEKDEQLFEQLIPEVSRHKNIELVNADVLRYQYLKHLKLTSSDQRIAPFVVVANLPYSASKPIVMQFLEADVVPERMIVMLQKEVAYQMLENPSKRTVFGLIVQYYADTAAVLDVSPEAFRPRPEVDSAVVVITPREKPVLFDERRALFHLIKMGFSSRRKKLSHNLSVAYGISKEEVEDFLKKDGWNENIRAEELVLNDWYKVYEKYREKIQAKLDIE